MDQLLFYFVEDKVQIMNNGITSELGTITHVLNLIESDTSKSSLACKYYFYIVMTGTINLTCIIGTAKTFRLCFDKFGEDHFICILHI